ncbi:hypothetical protein GGR56DRAFT_541675 [Xylariaceae sp. FL0804]|nr:hypothetical protein GGR56DRAFT_541675 [Xylariaceae sp. FL0804]
MAIINQAVAGGAQFVARAVEYQIRQAVTSSAESSTTSAASTTSPFSSPSPAGTVTPSSIGTVPSPTTPAPSATTTSSGKSGGGGGTSSPLLFFVALGFGVVFTNLWIIVGVKYCFRYNARNRQMRGLDENGEPINLENMPTRPHRRRREKKLMTMDEVNDKFPMMKYKTWVLERAREGLPTTGGVSAPGSRANSVVSVEGIVPEINAKEREVPESRADTGAARTSSDREGDQPRASSDNLHASPENGAAGDLAHTGALTQSQTVQTVASTIVKEEETRGSVDEEEDEQINAALPPELMGTSGDTCAICIDTLEDDDDVRGLTCGHAFHAVCLDPWLTNRRACCPLCKADYYTPKPRNAPAEADPNNPASANPGDPSRNNGRMNMPRAPQRSFTSWTQFH